VAPPRVDIIVNRRAHNLVLSSTNSTRGVFEELSDALRGRRAEGRGWLHVSESLDDLAAIVAKIRERGTECVVLAGGDGSYMAGTTALFHAFADGLPPIGFAPGGTVCTVARNWAPYAYGQAYARHLIECALDEEVTVTRRPTLRVRDDRGGDRIGFIFGAGLVARFFDAYYDAQTQGRALGYGTAARLVARIFAGSFMSGALANRVLTPGPARIFVDGQRQAPDAWSIIAASVVRDLGLHMHLLYRAAESTSAFHFVASALPPRQLSPQVGRVLLGRSLTGEGRVDVLAREVTIELGESGAPSTYVLDGDRIDARTVTVTPGPVIRYLSPSR
jgi:diacylglycerol kinase family enzyme